MFGQTVSFGIVISGASVFFDGVGVIDIWGAFGRSIRLVFVVCRNRFADGVGVPQSGLFLLLTAILQPRDGEISRAIISSLLYHRLSLVWAWRSNFVSLMMQLKYLATTWVFNG